MICGVQRKKENSQRVRRGGQKGTESKEGPPRQGKNKVQAGKNIDPKEKSGTVKER